MWPFGLGHIIVYSRGLWPFGLGHIIVYSRELWPFGLGHIIVHSRFAPVFGLAHRVVIAIHGQCRKIMQVDNTEYTKFHFVVRHICPLTIQSKQ